VPGQNPANPQPAPKIIDPRIKRVEKAFSATYCSISSCSTSLSSVPNK